MKNTITEILKKYTRKNSGGLDDTEELEDRDLKSLAEPKKKNDDRFRDPPRQHQAHKGPEGEER